MQVDELGGDVLSCGVLIDDLRPESAPIARSWSMACSKWLAGIRSVNVPVFSFCVAAESTIPPLEVAMAVTAATC